MAVNTTAIKDLLRPGLAAVFGDYPSYPAQWTEIFGTYTSDKAIEYETEMRYTALAGFRPQGAPTMVDSNMGQRFVTQYQSQYVGLMIILTRQALVDNLYKTKFPQMVKSLKRSMLQTKEILGANVLNNAFNASFPIADGQPLCSTSHPIDTGVVANTPSVAADLNEASLEAGIIAMRQFRDAAGLICMTKPKKLIVGPQGEFAACRLLRSEYRIGTPNNDISALYNMSSVPEGFRVNQFITLPNAWFLLSDAPDSFKMYQREALETDMYVDMDTDNLKAKAVERYAFGVSNFRGVYGSNGP